MHLKQKDQQPSIQTKTLNPQAIKADPYALGSSLIYDENTSNPGAKLYRKEILIPVFLMVSTLIAGSYTGFSIPQLIVIATGCIWYIVSCYRVFREDQ